jgi:hypothetical protein
MTLDEFKDKFEKAEEWRSRPIEEVDMRVDDSMDDELHEQLLLAHSLLSESMRMLGFYGDRKLVPKGIISPSDQQLMLRHAHEIEVFVNGLELAELS